MTLHLVKLCVGTASIEELALWQKENRLRPRRSGMPACCYHTTFQTPKRTDELLAGGSLYWVIKGVIQARQRLMGFEDGAKEDGSPCCLILLDPEITAVAPVARKAFQGWRYLEAGDAPADLKAGRGRGIEALPPALRRELAQLCLL